MKNLLQNRIIKLCGVAGCCPTLELKDKEIIIKDDFGGKVCLTQAQVGDLIKKLSR